MYLYNILYTKKKTVIGIYWKYYIINNTLYDYKWKRNYCFKYGYFLIAVVSNSRTYNKNLISTFYC